MKLKITIKPIVCLLFFVFFSSQKSFSQCFQIESILVDACGADEGLNEMVRFKVGNAPLNTSTLNVDWPSNNWQGLIKNATTAAKVAALNADIIDAGGCGQLLEPTGGVLPANASVILVTSFNMDTNLNSFGALTETIYMIFQNNPAVVGGHFGNYGTSALRTLEMNFGACTDVVTYNRSLLINQAGTNVAADGATVLFTPAGAATYVNYGCSAPVPPFTVEAGTTPLSVCAGNTVALTGTALGHQSVSWTAPSGTFSNSTNLSTSYTVPANAAGQTIVLTLTATNSCNLAITDTVTLNVIGSTTPTFTLPTTLCNGAAAPVLPTTSTNGIVGTWLPAVMSNTANGSYVFTPNAGQCAAPFTLNVVVTNSITPSFTLPTTICSGTTAPTLPATSTNGITGTWLPTVINTTTNGSYVFTPTAGQCSASFTLNVTVSNSITPTFTLPTTICSGATAPSLPTTSNNGITGTWSPTVINTTTNGSYLFTPTAGQCGAPFTLNVTITNTVAPTFTIANNFCNGTVAPTLPTTSNNGITGVWSPAVVSNTANGSYVFTPNAGQCSTPFTLNVVVSNNVTPAFTLPTTICSGTTAPTLPATSTNGVTGVWSPAVVSNTANGSYLFTPNAGQCSASFTLNVTVSNSITPTFTLPTTICSGTTAPSLPTTSNNGITGTWSPTVINTTTNGSYLFTPTAGQCGAPFTLNVTITNTVAPTFTIANNFCNGAVAPTLPTTSNNGITGVWSPAVVSNTASGSYVFTPNAGQCSTPFTLNVTVNTNVTPAFTLPTTICSGTTAPTLPATSTNGITGTWLPTVINTTTNGSYVFTPTAGQCSVSFTLNVTITNSIAPTFIIATTFCSGTTAPILPTTSTNGIVGTWLPAVISNTANGSYVFTPNAGQCGETFTLTVTVTQTETPDFDTALTICSGETVPALSTTSPNGITGVWSPSVIDNTANGSYVFTPNAGQCATAVTLQVTLSTFEIDFDQNCVNGAFIVTALPLNNSFDPDTVSYLWKNSQGAVVGMNEETLNITALMNVTSISFPATYQVTISNAAGCSDTENVIIYGAFCTIPKGISPNNDNQNDSFDLTGLGVDDIKIYNRYGTEVYHQRNYTNQWNGQSDKGDELPDATYFYVIKRNTGENVTGWVYINR